MHWSSTLITIKRLNIDINTAITCSRTGTKTETNRDTCGTKADSRFLLQYDMKRNSSYVNVLSQGPCITLKNV